MSEPKMTHRCDWCGDDPLYIAYHDTEWGVPEYDGQALWEKLILEGFQAGLSWITILRKRDAFRAAFEGFDPEIIATWDQGDVSRLMADPTIVRHRGKIEATIGNARACLELGGSEAFSDWVWRYVNRSPMVNLFEKIEHVPSFTPLSQQLSKDMKKAGFKFCGPTITYAWMQACGLVNDHLISCHRHKPIANAAPPANPGWERP